MSCLNVCYFGVIMVGYGVDVDILSTAWVAKIRRQPSLTFASPRGRGPVQGQPQQLGGAIARGEEQGTQVGDRRVFNNSQGKRPSSTLAGCQVLWRGAMHLQEVACPLGRLRCWQ